MLLWGEYHELCAVFPGLALPRFVESVQAYFEVILMNTWSACLVNELGYSPGHCHSKLEALTAELETPGAEKIFDVEVNFSFISVFYVCILKLFIY